jgi:hypothetical protein
MILSTVLLVFGYWIALGCMISLLMYSFLMFARLCELLVSWMRGLNHFPAKKETNESGSVGSNPTLTANFGKQNDKN